MRTIETIEQLAGMAGQEIGTSAWVTVTQEMINLFADSTGDHQWIHVDVERAKAGPFGAPIAHGFLTLSLLPRLMAEAFTITQRGMGVNYGLNKVRFMSPVPAGSRVRARVTLAKVERIEKNGLQNTWQVTIEREGIDKPVCVAETIGRIYP